MSDHRELKCLAEACVGVRGVMLIGKRVEFHAAANPAAVLELIAEIEVLREENAKLNSDNKSMRGLIRKRHKQHESRKQTLKHMAKKVEQQ